MRWSRIHSTALLCILPLSCLSESSLEVQMPAMTALRATDARGEAAVLDALPRRPRLLLRTAASMSTEPEEAPWLFEGPYDEHLRGDLQRLPLTAASEQRLIPTHKWLLAGALAIEPLTTLRRGAVYTLAMPGPEGTGFGVELRIEDSDSAGAALYSSLPANEAHDVPAALKRIFLAYDGHVQGFEAGVWVENMEGLAVAGHVESVSCDDVETAAVSCITWVPELPLTSGQRYLVRSGRALQDAHGAELPELRNAFTTIAQSTDSRAAPSFVSEPCALDELSVPGGCALVYDDQIQLHVVPNAYTRVLTSIADQTRAQLPASPAQLVFSGLTPDTRYVLSLQAMDAAERAAAFEQALQTAPTLATLSITEVYADPNGREPDQEFVELLNYGPTPVALDGIALADAPSEVGTRITTDAVLPPGARAVLVGSAFDPKSARDPAPAPGALIVRVPKTLTRAGLSNAGEDLYLRDAQDRRLSGAPRSPEPEAGRCLVRISADPRARDPGSFDYAPSLCTPGY